MTNFQWISLCNVIYKLVSKVITNRLKLLLDLIISSFQSAFILEHIITNNILIAHELLNTMRKHSWGKIGQMAIKLDMFKAYDHVEWAYLEADMKALGFVDGLVQVVMRCVPSARYLILINGCLGQNFTLTRGLRQGDPLSLYLFLFWVEGLSSLVGLLDQGVILRVSWFQGVGIGLATYFLPMTVYCFVEPQ